MQTNDRFYDKYRERKLFTIALLITIDSFQTWFSSIYIHHLLRKNMSKIFIAYHKNSISKFINTSVFCFSILFTLSLHSETIKKFKFVTEEVEQKKPNTGEKETQAPEPFSLSLFFPNDYPLKTSETTKSPQKYSPFL